MARANTTKEKQMSQKKQISFRSLQNVCKYRHRRYHINGIKLCNGKAWHQCLHKKSYYDKCNMDNCPMWGHYSKDTGAIK